MSDTIRHLALMLPALLLSLCVHEWAHAWVATRLGDSTPERQGRLTLSPLSHVDPIGSLLFPVILIATTGRVFGWAKPVQFNPANFSRRISMRGGAVLTAVAGPLSNVVLALITALLVRLAVAVGLTAVGDTGSMVYAFLSEMFVLNCVLAVFNILPLPPLDGAYLLPRSLDDFKEKLSRYSFLVLFVLFFLPLPGLGGSLGGLILGPLANLLQRAVVWVAFLGA